MSYVYEFMYLCMYLLFFIRYLFIYLLFTKCLASFPPDVTPICWLTRVGLSTPGAKLAIVVGRAGVSQRSIFIHGPRSSSLTMSSASFGISLDGLLRSSPPSPRQLARDRDLFTYLLRRRQFLAHIGHLPDELLKTIRRPVIIGDLLRQGQGHRKVQRAPEVLLLVPADAHGPQGGAVRPLNTANDVPRPLLSPRAPETGELAMHDVVTGDKVGILFRDPVFA